jgi:hypothetical protein
MREISEQEANSFLEMKENPGRIKSEIRLYLEQMDIGKYVIFEKEIDYEDYRKVYHTKVSVERSSEKKFSFKQSGDRKSVLIKRVV